jgi:hypothetical protein
MRIYIDEAGAFVPPNPPHSSFSLVLALIIPTVSERELFYEFLRLVCKVLHARAKDMVSERIRST